MEYILTGTITGAPIGSSYIWRVIQADTECAYSAGDELEDDQPGPQTVTTDPYTTTLTIEVDLLTCQQLIIALIVVVDGEECIEEYFSLTGEPGDYTHYECLASDTSYCGLVLGEYNPNDPEHFLTIEECLACTSCACNVDSGCNSIAFSAQYICTPDVQDTNTMTLCLTYKDPDIVGPITVTGITANVFGSPVQLLPMEVSLTQQGDCITFSPIGLLPNGVYYITIYVETDVCPLSPLTILVNCVPIVVDPPIFSACCVNTDPTTADQGNLGNLSCNVVDLSALDTNDQDLILDFGMNLVADKIEVYAGVIDCALIQDIPNDYTQFLIAATKYIGDPTLCLNQNGCFAPAQPSDTSPVLAGPRFIEGIEDGDLYSLVDWQNLTPPFSFTQTCSTPSGVTCGGPVIGQGRLIIPANSYDLTYITIVVHNNGAEQDGTDCCIGMGNNTAWRYFLICPDCAPCALEFKSEGYYCDLVEPNLGGITFGVETNTYDVEEPLRFVITPIPQVQQDIINSLNGAWVRVTDLGFSDYFYQLSLYDKDNDGIDDSVSFLATDVIDWNTHTVYVGYDDNLGTNAIDVPDGGYELYMIDGKNCEASSGTVVDCGCAGQITGVSGSTEYCDPADIYIVIGTSDFPCTVGNNAITVFDEDWGLSVTPLGQDKIVIAGIYDEPGASFPVTNSFTTTIECNGCSDTITVPITINSFTCRLGSSVTNTTCGLSNGDITISSTDVGAYCTAQLPITYVWEDGITTGTINAIPFAVTRSGLPAGTYTITLTNSNGCVTTITRAVEDDGTVTADLTADMEIPCGDPDIPQFDITGIGGGTGPYDIYLYSVGTAAPIHTALNEAGPTYTLIESLTAGSYTITIVDTAGCIFNDDFIITEEDLPVLPLPYIVSSSCNLMNGGWAYTAGTLDFNTYELYWGIGTITTCSDPGLFTYTPVDINDTGAVVAFLTAGTYSVCYKTIGTDCCTCQTFTIPNAGTPPAPPILNAPTICLGSTATLTATCPIGTTAKWRESGTLPWIYSGASYTVTPTATTSYDCKCQKNTSPTCSSTIDTTTVTVNPLPTMTLPAAVSTCSGGSVDITQTNCTGTMEWSYGLAPLILGTSVAGGTVSAVNNTHIVINGVTTPVVITGKCTEAGCYNTDETPIIVNPLPSIVTQNLSGCTGGGAINLSNAVLSISGTPAIAGTVAGYTLTYHTGANCSGASIATTVSAGTFWVRAVHNSTGCESCKSFTVALSPALTPVITGLPTVCTGTGYTLSATPAGALYTYQWQQASAPGGPWVNVGGNTSTYSAPSQPAATTLYYKVTVSNGLCTGTSSVFTVNIISSPALNIADVELCQANTGVGVISGITPSNIFWTSSNPLIVASGCSNSGTIIYNKTVAGTATVTVNVNTNGVPGCLTGSGCPSTDTFTVTVNPKPTLSVQDVSCVDGLFADYIDGFDDVNYNYGYYQTVGGTSTCPPPSTTPISDSTEIPSSGIYNIEITDVATGCKACDTMNANLPISISAIEVHTCAALECSPGYARVYVTLSESLIEGTVSIVSTLLEEVVTTLNANGTPFYDFGCLPTGSYQVQVLSLDGPSSCIATDEFSVNCCISCQNPDYIAVSTYVAIDTTASTTPVFNIYKSSTNVDNLAGTISIKVYNASNILQTTVTDSFPFATTTAHGLGNIPVKTITEWTDADGFVRSRVYQSFTINSATAVVTVPHITNSTIEGCTLKRLEMAHCGQYYVGTLYNEGSIQNICDLTPPIEAVLDIDLPIYQIFAINFISNYPSCACGVSIPIVDFQEETLFQSISIQCQE